MTRLGKRHLLEKRLQTLQAEILTMSSLVGASLTKSVEILQERDFDDAHKLIAADQIINNKRYDISSNSLALIATQHPLASDLRLISSYIEIATELERMHDYAKGIAKVALLIGKESETDIPNCLSIMAQQAQDMLYRAMDALIDRNVNLARIVAAHDDKVDALYKQVYWELTGSEPRPLQYVNHTHHLLWVAHNLERAADRVTNICEWITYAVTGQHVEMNSEIEAPPAPR